MVITVLRSPGCAHEAHPRPNWRERTANEDRSAVPIDQARLPPLSSSVSLERYPAYQRRCGRTILLGQRSITPQATRAPEFPAGSVFSSSGSAWTISVVPPDRKTEFGPSFSVTSESIASSEP